MREISGDELKKIQLEILAVVDAFCRENQIRYWLDSGTLLGAVRHKGYIPWDDDIDIGMLREDYDRFISCFNQKNKRYQAISNELTKDCFYPFTKILDTQTVLYEPDENGIKLSINIDVFVYDNAPESDWKCKWQYNRRDIYAFLNSGQVGMFLAKTWYKKFAKQALFYLLNFFRKGYFSSKVVENAKKYKKQETAFVGNFTSVSRIKGKKQVFDSFLPGEFEGKIYPIPVGYDEWLRQFYGDYQKLPPVEKRVSHHTFQAFVKDAEERML